MTIDTTTGALIGLAVGFCAATVTNWANDARLHETIARREADLINLGIRTGRIKGLTYVTSTRQAATDDGDGGEYIRTLSGADWEKLVRQSAGEPPLARTVEA